MSSSDDIETMHTLASVVNREMRVISFTYCIFIPVVIPQYKLEWEDNSWSLVLANCTGRVQSIFSDTKSSLVLSSEDQNHF